MKGPIPKPLNSVQKCFNEICGDGGGPHGGPTRGRVLDLLHAAGTSMNENAIADLQPSFQQFENRNVWHVCFALGLPWGHLAKDDVDFIDAATRCLADWNDEDLKTARGLYGYRGPDVIEQALLGAYIAFENVRLPETIPTSLQGLRTVQDRWLGFILGPNRPPYIGAWNATAMFMLAMFYRQELAEALVEPDVMLPPSGAVKIGLSRLHAAHYLACGPDGGDLDDEAFEPGVLFANNALFAEVRKGREDWSLLDVHSALYILGTGQPESKDWVDGL